MKDLIQRWLHQDAQWPGVLACGVRFPDKNAFTRSWSLEFPAPALENALRCVSDTFQVLKINFFPNERVRWVYDNVFLHCVRRDDGICLGIFTPKDPQSFDPGEVDRLLAEFRGLGGS
jgi:hypothetical protein